MPQESVPIGMAVTLLAGVAYALPGVKTTLYTDAAAPTITQSNTQAFTSSNAVTVTAGVATPSAAFIKAAANTVVFLKKG